MAFSQATILQVYPPRAVRTHVFVSWQSSAPVGSVWYQAYVNGGLAWWGQATSCYLPLATAGPVRVDIGTVAPGEETISFASSLPAAPQRRVTLTWQGGNFQGDAIAGFYVYGSAVPGGPISYTKALATITAYPGGILVGTGWGETQWGAGPWGLSTGTYSWTSGALDSGIWSFGVVSFDAAGNTGAPQVTTTTVAVPPREPALMPDGLTRLTYSLAGAPTPVATLTWLASPA